MRKKQEKGTRRKRKNKKGNEEEKGEEDNDVKQDIMTKKGKNPAPSQPLPP